MNQPNFRRHAFGRYPPDPVKAGPTNSSLIGIFRGWNTGNGGIKCGSDERITGGSDDASASIAGIEPRSGHLRRPRCRHVVVSMRYGCRRWSRRIGDWQHGHRWGGTDAARHWNPLEPPKTPSGRRASQQCQKTRWERATVQTEDGRQSIGLPLCRRPLRRLPANGVPSVLSIPTAPFEGRGHAPL
jgi:hypothetical protein